ncbi:MAG TPA: hypothetical protein VGS16_08985 [Candidatus Dormibacteraeota bacterium]|nr:hypothetical protein [Candidatus Dormibacteraeota bacterium]
MRRVGPGAVGAAPERAVAARVAAVRIELRAAALRLRAARAEVKTQAEMRSATPPVAR